MRCNSGYGRTRAPPLVVGAVSGEPLVRSDMQPLPLFVYPHAGLFEVGNGGVDNLLLDLFFYRKEGLTISEYVALLNAFMFGGYSWD